MRIAEIFRSVQGEGRLTGTESIFVRASGCNLRCRYCDTPYASWNPEGEDLSVAEILDRVEELRRSPRPEFLAWFYRRNGTHGSALLASQQWHTALTPCPSPKGRGDRRWLCQRGGDCPNFRVNENGTVPFDAAGPTEDTEVRHVVITGGEPMLFAELTALTAGLRRAGWHITIETSGTVHLPVECDLMSISPKLSNSTPLAGARFALDVAPYARATCARGRPPTNGRARVSTKVRGRSS